MQEFKIPAASCQPVLQWAAEFEGPGFLQISEEEFKARLPQVNTKNPDLLTYSWNSCLLCKF